MRYRSNSKDLQGTIKEMLGTAVSVGCTVDGEDPRDIQVCLLLLSVEIHSRQLLTALLSCAATNRRWRARVPVKLDALTRSDQNIYQISILLSLYPVPQWQSKRAAHLNSSHTRGVQECSSLSSYLSMG